VAEMINQTCSCPCGKSTFAITSRPFARFVCHCTICQSLYRAPFADVTLLWAKSVVLPETNNIQFKTYRSPPALSRGSCASCGLPAAGFLTVAPFLRLAFIPSRNYPGSYVLPAVALHIFYHSRVGDIDDHLPKCSGYWRSQLAVTKLVLGAGFPGLADP
jgi:hypothetical protein